MNGRDRPLEVEIKLTFGPGTARALARHRALAQVKAGASRRRQQHDRYFDTAAFDLARKGLALRVRRTSSGARQTLKADPERTGLWAREEYEWDVDTDAPNLEVLQATPYGRWFKRLDAPLEEIFRVETVRTDLPLAWPDGTRAVASLDRGEIHAGSQSERFAELEIELGAGDVNRLFDLALALATDLPLTVSWRSKGQHGLALAGYRESLAPADAAQRPLDPRADLAASLADLAALALAALLERAATTLRRQDPEDIHQVRLCLRRLRTVLKTARYVENNPEWITLGERVHDFYRVLGRARDWDVFSNEILVTGASGPLAQRLRSMRALARETRAERLNDARGRLAEREFQILLLDLARQVFALRLAGARGTHQEATVRALEHLAKRDRRLRERVRELSRQSPSEQHDTRRLARHAKEEAQLLAPLLARGGGRRYLRRLAGLQSALGGLHDWDNARHCLEELVREGDPGLDDWMVEHWRSALRGARRRGRRFRKTALAWRPDISPENRGQ